MKTKIIKIFIAIIVTLTQPIVAMKRTLETDKSTAKQIQKKVSSEPVQNNLFEDIMIGNFDIPDFEDETDDQDVSKQSQQIVCKFCNKNFSSKNTLRTHQLRNCPNSPYKTERFTCEFCDATYNNKQNLDLHLKRGCSNKSPRTIITCDDCDESFLSLGILKTHQKYNCPATKQKNIQCETCLKFFTSPYNLKEHQKYSCENKSKLVCQFCDKSFSKPQNLKRHISESCKKNPENNRGKTNK